MPKVNIMEFDATIFFTTPENKIIGGLWTRAVPTAARLCK